ncbi:MAG: hypothetical protein ACT4PW_07190 [Acidimicrobiia bacterium]
MPCPRCSRPLARITVKVRHRDLEMRSCTRCDLRSWFGDDGEMTIADILGRDPVRSRSR